MLARIIKHSLGIAVRQTSLPQKAVQSVQQISSKAKRIELALLTDYHIPQLASRIDSLQIIKKVIEYNPCLTHGGFDFDQFPLVKMLHIGLKLVQEENGDKKVWSKFQKIVKHRLHRCTIDEYMKLLYIMIKIWPFYRFNTDFISSICLGLKKQIIIMNDDELKALFRIITANQDSNNRFYNPILLDLQKTVLKTVTKKWQARIDKLKGRSLDLDRLMMWTSMGVSLSIINNIKDFIVDYKSIRLAELFTIIYRKALINNVSFKRPQVENLQIGLNFLSIFEPTYHLFGKQQRLKQQNTLKQEYTKLKGSFIAFGSKGIEHIIKTTADPLIVKNLLTVVQSNIVEQMLNEQDQNALQDPSSTVKYPKITDYVQNLMKKDTTNEKQVADRLSLLVEILNKQIMNWQQIQILYQSLPLHMVKESTLEITYMLLQMQLTLYAYQSEFQPKRQAKDLILDYLSKESVQYRNFDWLAFNYLRLLSKIEEDKDFTGIELYTTSAQESSIVKLIKKLITEVEISKFKTLVEQQKEMQLNNPHIVSIKKFFTEVRLHDMLLLEPVFKSFYRLPHFTNQTKKMTINAYSQSEIKSPKVILEKKLFNDLGWKVINLQMPDFMSLSLSERVQLITQQIASQQKLIDEKGNKLIE